MSESAATPPATRVRYAKPYAEYKDSGVPWLAEMPRHWKASVLKRSFSVQLGKMLQSSPERPEDTLEPYLRAANILWQGVDLTDLREMWFSPREKKQYALKEGDLLISEGGDAGRCAIWAGELQDCYIQNAINRVRSKGRRSTRFLYYWMYALKHSGYIDMLCSRATICHFTREKVERVHVFLPPVPEERGIADFLDRETAKIDALIAKKERLIELLHEKRTALITHAVTKGLDPDAPMKDSGVEWLGEIPAHWEVKRLKYAVRFSGGGTPPKAIADYWDGHIAWVSPKDMKAETITETEDYITEDGLRESATRLISPGAVLVVVRSGILRHSIPVAVNARPVTLNQDMKALEPNEGLAGQYLKFLVAGHQRALLVEWRKQGATVESIEHELLANSIVPIPPLAEQDAIVCLLDGETAEIDALIRKVQSAIERLKEYRNALISAAVTGKIDVREAVK